LEGALDRSLELATSMDARGYGRRSDVHSAVRMIATGATIAGLLLAAVGVYGVTDAGSEFGLGLPLMAAAAVLCAVGFAARGRRLQRSRYRPDRWGAVEWLIVGSGLVALGTMVLAHALKSPGMVVSFVSTVAVPPLPLLPVLGILVAALPAFVVPARRVVPVTPTRELESLVAT
jgi:energy-coupling factor transport system permease protein